ncbi:VWA domain-containing protein, partial [Phycisphaerales bacterium]|nr:VWA domain-containing protein [Phycisphaerales bacterium]
GAARSVSSGEEAGSDTGTGDASSGDSASGDATGDGEASDGGSGESSASDSGGEAVGDDEVEPALPQRPRPTDPLEIPELEFTPIDSLEERQEIDGLDRVVLPRMVAMTGIWEEDLPAGTTGAADFAPGGYDRRLMGIDITNGRMTVIQSHGSVVMSADFDLLVMQDSLRIASAVDGSTDFSGTSPQAIQALGGTFESPISDLPLILEVEGDDDRRVLGDRRYRRSTFEEYRSLRGDQDDDFVPGDVVGRIGVGGGSSRPAQGGAPTVDFFGTRASGRFFCYVVDISGSMSGEKLEALKRELIRSIESLSDSARFQVVFFSDGATTLSNSWMRAGGTAVRRFQRKLAPVGTQGGTNPAPALHYAFTSLNPRPDVLFLLTDGQMPADVPAVIRGLNDSASMTQVNAIAFGQGSVVAPLQQIADENGGVFNSVP